MFRLALCLGMTVEELGVRMSSRELSEWLAFERIEPFGDVRADIRQAMTTMFIANQWRKKGQPPIEIDAFLPYLPKAQASDQSILSLAKTLGAACGDNPKP